MDSHEKLDHAIEEAGEALGKSPREIEAAKENMHDAVNAGIIDNEMATRVMDYIKDGPPPESRRESGGDATGTHSAPRSDPTACGDADDDNGSGKMS